MDWKKIKDSIENAAGVVSLEFSTSIASTDWFKSINDYSSELSKSMDSNFLKEGISKVMTPNNHRIMDGGHDFFSSIDKVHELGEKNNWTDLETFEQWAKAYFTDMSSSAGMPMFGKYTDEIYEFLKSINIDEKHARDFVTLNGQEALEAALGIAIGGTALFFAWKSEDKERFSKTISGLFITSAISLNPVLIFITTIALAFGYQKLVCKEAMARGAILTSVSMITSAIIPGTLLVGLIPAIWASYYLNKKMGKDFKPIEYSAQFYRLIKSEEFRSNCERIFKQYEEATKTKAA